MTSDRIAAKELEKEFALLRKRMENRPVKVAGKGRSRRYMKKLMALEVLSSSLLNTIERSLHPIPVLLENARKYREVWARHQRVLESWARRTNITRSKFSFLYRMTGFIMASTVFPRDSRRLFSFMIYVGEKHIDRITIANLRLPDKTTRKLVSKLLKEKDEAIRELKNFKSSYFTTGMNSESQLRHLDRSLEREFDEYAKKKATTPSPDMNSSSSMLSPVGKPGDIPRTGDDDIFFIGNP